MIRSLCKLASMTSVWALSSLAAGALGCARSEPAAASPPAPTAAPATEPAAFSVRVVGHGPPLVLIPGLASAGEVWDDVVEHEKARHTCHVLTVAGFAGQPSIPAPLLPKLKDALATYVRTKGLERPVIVGHSLGGVVALDLAATHPALVGPLVIVDAFPYLPAAQDPAATPAKAGPAAEAMRRRLASATPEQRRSLQRGMIATMVTEPAKAEVVLGWSLRSDPEAVGQALVEVMTTDLRPALSNVRSRTLVLGTWVGAAPLATRSQVEETFRAQYQGLRGVEIRLAEKARHFVMLDDPAFVAQEIDRFLDAKE